MCGACIPFWNLHKNKFPFYNSTFNSQFNIILRILRSGSGRWGTFSTFYPPTNRRRLTLRTGTTWGWIFNLILCHHSKSTRLLRRRLWCRWWWLLRSVACSFAAGGWRRITTEVIVYVVGIAFSCSWTAIALFSWVGPLVKTVILSYKTCHKLRKMFKYKDTIMYI